MDENEEINEEEQDAICPICGLRQYSDTCNSCGIKIKEEVEKEKSKDDDDEYDWRERK